MTNYWPGWLDYPDHVQWALVNAEFKRMQRTKDQADSIYRRCARQRIRFILWQLRQR